AALANEFAVGGHIERSERQIQLIKAAGWTVLRSHLRIQFLQSLQCGDANFLGMLPAEDFAGFENAHQTASGIVCVEPADGLDRLYLNKRSSAIGQIAVDDVLQAAKGISIAGDPNFVDDERQKNWINVIDQFEQNAAARGSAACGDLADGAILGSAL